MIICRSCIVAYIPRAMTDTLQCEIAINPMSISTARCPVFTPLDCTPFPCSCTPDGNLTRRRWRRRQSVDTKPSRTLEFWWGNTPNPRSQEPNIVYPSVALYYKFRLRKPADGLGENPHVCLAVHEGGYEGQNATYKHHGALS